MSLTFQQERLSTAGEELDEILRREQFAYITEAPGISERPLCVNWSTLLHLEDADMLQIVTARDDGRMVGYVVHIIIPQHHHYAMKMAVDDFYYMSASHRGSGMGKRMVLFAEAALRERGVDRVMYHERLVGDTARAGNLARFFASLGFRRHETVWIKDLTTWH